MELPWSGLRRAQVRALRIIQPLLQVGTIFQVLRVAFDILGQLVRSRFELQGSGGNSLAKGATAVLGSQWQLLECFHLTARPTIHSLPRSLQHFSVRKSSLMPDSRGFGGT